MNLARKYHPQRWEDVIGHEKAVSKLLALRDRGGFGGRAYWITGKSGTGKGCIASLIANDVADEWGIDEVDAGPMSVADVTEIEAGLRIRPLGSKGGRCVIVNEAHGLRKAVIRQLLVTLERIPAHVAWIFTTTNDGAESLFEDNIDGGPFASRCYPVRLDQRGISDLFAARAREIAVKEGIDGFPPERYSRLLKDCNSNLRMALARIEAGEFGG